MSTAQAVAGAACRGGGVRAAAVVGGVADQAAQRPQVRPLLLRAFPLCRPPGATSHAERCCSSQTANRYLIGGWWASRVDVTAAVEQSRSAEVCARGLSCGIYTVSNMYLTKRAHTRTVVERRAADYPAGKRRPAAADQCAGPESDSALAHAACRLLHHSTGCILPTQSPLQPRTSSTPLFL